MTITELRVNRQDKPLGVDADGMLFSFTADAEVPFTAQGPFIFCSCRYYRVID